MATDPPEKGDAKNKVEGVCAGAQDFWWLLFVPEHLVPVCSLVPRNYSSSSSC